MRRGMGLMIGLAALLVTASSYADTRVELTLEQSLRAAETAFAKTMADRNHAAFATFIADEAIFFGRDGEIRGKKAVVDSWAGLFQGKEAPFSWRPEIAVVLESGTLGLTSGPVFNPEGTQTGTFQSIWRLKAEKTWEVIFDKGGPYCEEKK